MDIRKTDWRRGVFILVAIAIVAAYIIIHQITSVSSQESKNNLVETTAYASATADGYVQLVQENISALSKNSDLAKLSTDKSAPRLAQSTGILDGIKNQLNTVERIGVYGADGKLIVENEGTSRTMGNQLSSNTFFKQAIESKDTVISPVLVSPVTDRNTIAVASPLEVNDKVWGVVIGLVNFDDLKDFYKSVQGDGSYTVLLDKQGSLLLDTRSKKSDVAENKIFVSSNVPSAIYNAKDPETGDKVTRSYKQGSLFIASVTKDDKTLNRVTRRVTLTIIIGAIIINLILDILFTARVIMTNNRIDQLKYVIDSINKGGSIAPVDDGELKRKDKLADLAVSINILAENEAKKSPFNKDKL